MSGNRQGPVFNSGRDQQVVYAELGDAMLTANTVNGGRSADAAPLAELAAVRSLLESLGGPANNSAALLTKAEQAAKAPNSHKAEVIGYVEQAVKLAAGVNGFAEQADKLIPRLKHVATWAGHTWEAWRPTLGL